MQDTFQSTTITQPPSVREPVVEKQGVLKHAKFIASVLVTVSIIGGYFFYTDYKENQILEAQAAILRQAVKLDKISEFSVYKNQGPGLYKGSRNTPELTQKALIQKQIDLIRPLGVNGFPDDQGKIGFVYIGDSFTNGEFEMLSEYVDGNNQANKQLAIVDGSNKGLDVTQWEKSQFAWEHLKGKVEDKGMTTKQVQVLWINLGFGNYYDNIDTDIQAHADLLEKIIKNYLGKYPETKLIYLSSPRYSGLSKNPKFQEPWTYEAGFAVRELINRQEKGDLVFRESNTQLKSEPALLWGPYLWNGINSDDTQFNYKQENFEEDGITLTVQGKQRMSVDLFDFWSSYEFSKVWFSP